MTRFTMVACRGAGVGFANDHWIGQPHLWYEWSRTCWLEWRTRLTGDRSPNRCWRCGEKIK